MARIIRKMFIIARLYLMEMNMPLATNGRFPNEAPLSFERTSPVVLRYLLTQFMSKDRLLIKSFLCAAFSPWLPGSTACQYF